MYSESLICEENKCMNDAAYRFSVAGEEIDLCRDCMRELRDLIDGCLSSLGYRKEKK